MDNIPLLIVLSFILAGLIVTFTGHQKFKPDNDSIETHDNWDGK